MADRGISPKTTNTVDLGSSSKKWRKVYATRIDEGTYIPGAYNKKETFTTSGTFVAPVTGTYKITLQGGGGGGGGAGTANTVNSSGGGGGQGGHLEIYEKLTAAVSYSYTIGTGGSGGDAGSTTAGSGKAGSAGGATSIIINGTNYMADGGGGGTSQGSNFRAGEGGFCYINDQIVSESSSGSPGVGGSGGRNPSGCGGGYGGANSSGRVGYYGGGGAGGYINGSTYSAGSAGGDGYICFEYYDPTLA